MFPVGLAAWMVLSGEFMHLAPTGEVVRNPIDSVQWRRSRQANTNFTDIKGRRAILTKVSAA